MRDDPVDEIRRVMKKEGVTEQDLGDRGVGRSMLWRLMTGRFKPRWGTIRAIFKAMGYDVFIHARKRR